MTTTNKKLKSIHNLIYEFSKSELSNDISSLNTFAEQLSFYYCGDISRSSISNWNKNGFSPKGSINLRKETTIEYANAITDLWNINFCNNSGSNNFISNRVTRFCDEFVKSEYYSINGYRRIFDKYEKSSKDRDTFVTFLAELLLFDSDYMKQNNNPNTDSSALSNSSTQYNDKKAVRIPQHLSILETNTKSRPFEYEFMDFDFFEKHNRLLLIGPGGQGKSQFLELLAFANTKVFDFVCIVPLVSVISNFELIKKDKKTNILKEYIIGYNTDYKKISIKNDKILVCLDGYNELVSCANEEQIGLVKAGIIDLKKHTNISIIVTSRKIASDEKLGIFSGFDIATLSDVPDKNIASIKKTFEDNGHTISQEVLELAKIPMYYNLISDLASYSEVDIVSKYDIFLKCYIRKAEQRLSDRSNDFNKTVYKYHFFIALPLLSQSKKYILNDTEFEKELYSISEKLCESTYLNKYAKPLVKNVSCNFNFTPWYDYPFTINDVIKPFFEDTVISVNAENKYFIHENWRDFLCAFFLVNNILLLKLNYSDKDLSSIIKLDQNVNSNVAELTLQGLQLYGVSDENAKNFSKLYSHPNNNEIVNLLKEIPNYGIEFITGLSKWFNAAVDINEYLQIELPHKDNKSIECLHEILNKFSENIFSLCEEHENYISLIRNNDIIKENIINILAKESEYFRRNRDYSNAQKYVELGYKLDSSNLFIINQKAKLFICYYQSIIMNENKASDLNPAYFTNLDEVKGFLLKDNSIYNIGINILEKNAYNGSFLSANLLGMILSKPAPYLVKNKIVHSLSYTKAMYYYLKIIFESGYSGREITYTIVSALSLLVNGYVSVKDTVKIGEFTRLNLKENDLTCVGVSPKSMNQQTLKLSKEIIKKSIGQDLNLLNYLRGSIELLDGDIEKAQGYFTSLLKSEEKKAGLKIYYVIRSVYNDSISNKDYTVESIKNLIDSMFTNIFDSNGNVSSGAIDDTHPIYYYLDVKRIVLSYDNSMNGYFSNLEKKYPEVKKLCHEIEALYM